MPTRSSTKTPQITYAQATTGESFAIREKHSREQTAREEAAINAAKELYRKVAMNAAKVARQKAALASREAIKIARKKAAKASRKAIKDAAARKESADQILVQVELVQEKIVDLQEEPSQGPSDDFENFLVQKLKEIEISILKWLKTGINDQPTFAQCFVPIEELRQEISFHAATITYNHWRSYHVNIFTEKVEKELHRKIDIVYKINEKVKNMKIDNSESFKTLLQLQEDLLKYGKSISKMREDDIAAQKAEREFRKNPPFSLIKPAYRPAIYEEIDDDE